MKKEELRKILVQKKLEKNIISNEEKKSVNKNKS